MSNDLELHVGTTADSSGLKSAADELDKTKHSSDDMGASFHEAGRESHDLDEALAKMRGSSEGAGTSFQEQAKGAHNLDEELAKLRAHLKDLESQYAATGERSLFKDIRSDRSLIGSLERIKKDLKDVEAEGRKASRATTLLQSSATSAFGAFVELGGAFTKGVGSTFSGIGEVAGPLKGALIAGAVAAAAEISPLIVGALGGAISAAVGAGGIAVGLVAAAKDPAVKAAMSTFGGELKDEFTAVGKPFVRPFQDALAILSADLKSLRLSDVFADAAPAVTGLAHTVGDFAKSVMPGFDAALQRAAPYMDQLDRGLMTVGQGLSSLLDDVSASPGDLQAFRQALDLIGSGLALTGKAVADAGAAWHLLNHEWANFYHALGAALFTMPALAHQFTDLGDRLDAYDKIGDHAIATTDMFGATVGAAGPAVQTLGTNANLATAATGALGQALSATQQAFLGFMGADISAEQALDDFAKSVQTNGRSLDVHSQAGRDNLRVLEELARAAADAAKETLNETGSVQKAQQTYEGFRKELYNLLIQMHYTKAEAQKLVDQWLGMDGLTATLTVKVKIKKEGELPFVDLGKASFGTAPAQHRAGGGSVMAGVPYEINERAGKEVYFPANGIVSPASLSPGWGGGPARHIIDLRLNGQTIKTIAIDDALARGVSQSTIAVAYP